MRAFEGNPAVGGERAILGLCDGEEAAFELLSFANFKVSSKASYCGLKKLYSRLGSGGVVQ